MGGVGESNGEEEMRRGNEKGAMMRRERGGGRCLERSKQNKKGRREKRKIGTQTEQSKTQKQREGREKGRDVRSGKRRTG